MKFAPDRAYRAFKILIKDKMFTGLASLMTVVTILVSLSLKIYQSLSSSSTILISLLVLTLIISLFVIIILFTNRIVTLISDRRKFIFKEYDGFISSAHSISRKIFDVEQPSCIIKSTHESIVVDSDCTCTVNRTFELMANDCPVQVFRINLHADETAEPIRYIGDIDFKAVCSGESGDQVKYLITKNNLYNKEICIFFLPEIQPETVRVLEISYKWPLFANDLLEKGQTHFKLDYRTQDSQEGIDITLEIAFDKELGMINFHTDAKEDAGELETAHHPENTETHWKWTYKSPSHLSHKLSFTASREQPNYPAP